MLIATQPVEKQVYELITPILEDMGYEPVRIKLMDVQGRRTLQIMLDRLDGAATLVEDCEKASRQISAMMDVEDPVDGAYDLQVSSPGMDRPLTRLKDFENYKGLETKFELKSRIDGYRKFRGCVAHVNGDIINIALMEKAASETVAPVLQVPFEQILQARLVLTDALIDWYEASSDV